MPTHESPIFARTYDLLRWLIPLTIKFPRQQRFVVAEALQGCILRLHERLIEAAHGEGAARLAALAQADVELDKLRHYLRLSHDLDLITTGQYEHAAERLAEIGRLLGAWRKSTSATIVAASGA